MPENGSADVFVHRDALAEGPDAYLIPGHKVWYSVVWDGEVGNYRACSCSGARTSQHNDPGPSNEVIHRRKKGVEKDRLNKGLILILHHLRLVLAPDVIFDVTLKKIFLV